MFKPILGPGHFSSRLNYNYDGKKARVSLKRQNEDYRLLDVWGLSYLVWLIEKNKQNPNYLCFELKTIGNQYKYEALKRRISYFNINNPKIKFELILNGKSQQLYDLNEIIKRPSNEIIIRDIKKRSVKDVPGRIEKDFQTFLFGRSIKESKSNLMNKDYEKIYERLAVLGSDFFKLKKSYWLIREFPIGAFDGKISEKTRILPTHLVDIVSFNNKRELAVIEIKLNDTKLEVMSQILDYILFFISYKKQIANAIKDYVGPGHFPKGFENKPIVGYVANNRFHRNFDKIKNFYVPKDSAFLFKLKQIILGKTNLF